MSKNTNINELLGLINNSYDILKSNEDIEEYIINNGGKINYSYDNIIIAVNVDDNVLSELQKNINIDYIQTLPLYGDGRINIGSGTSGTGGTGTSGTGTSGTGTSGTGTSGTGTSGTGTSGTGTSGTGTSGTGTSGTGTSGTGTSGTGTSGTGGTDDTQEDDWWNNIDWNAINNTNIDNQDDVLKKEIDGELNSVYNSSSSDNETDNGLNNLLKDATGEDSEEDINDIEDVSLDMLNDVFADNNKPDSSSGTGTCTPPTISANELRMTIGINNTRTININVTGTQKIYFELSAPGSYSGELDIEGNILSLTPKSGGIFDIEIKALNACGSHAVILYLTVN